MNRGNTKALGNGAMEIAANGDQNVCVKAQTWIHLLFSFFL